MPLYIDHHKTIEGATAQAVAEDHKKDLEVQHKHGVKTLRYWFSEDKGEVYCLFEAPNSEAAEAAYREAHRNLAAEIVEVKQKPSSIPGRVWVTVKQALIPNRTSQIWAIRIAAALMVMVLILILVGSYYGLRTSTSAQDIAAILSAVAWPIIVLGVVLLFHTPLRAILNRLADSMRMQKITLGAFRVTTEWSVEEAEAVLNEMQEAVLAPIKTLREPEYNLLLKIADVNGERTNQTVNALIPNFQRSSNVRKSEEHEVLRNLRYWSLIRPSGVGGIWLGGSWEGTKYPILTKYGSLAVSLYPKFADTGHSRSPKA